MRKGERVIKTICTDVAEKWFNNVKNVDVTVRSLTRLPSVTKCTHVVEGHASQLMETIKDNFHQDIVHYSRHGQLSMETGVYDLEHRSAQELFMRNERRTKLKEELEARRNEWPSILNG